MKTKSCIAFSILFILIHLFNLNSSFGKGKDQLSKLVQSDDVQIFKSLMKSLEGTAKNELFALHFQSILNVIEAKGNLSSVDSAFIKLTIPVFSDPSVPGYAADFNSYLDRSRPLTIAWVSQTDGAVSFFRLKLPKDWDPDKTYPLYVDLHGLTSIANNPIEYLTNYYRIAPAPTIAFEDGYQLSPWGRGNLWYLGISETDIWEGIDVIEKLVKIDPKRKYLVGHSMGGYGTWMIASKSADVWAAIGIEAGALWYGTDTPFSTDKIENLSAMPTYFVVGTSDGLYGINLQAFNLLKDAGNQQIEFVSFNGGHEKLAVNVENMYLWIKEFVNEDYTSISKLKTSVNNSLQIYPNPVQTITSIHLKLENPEYVTMTLFDINGKNLATVIDRNVNSGETIVPWSRGELLSGFYIYSLEIGQSKLNGKLVLF